MKSKCMLLPATLLSLGLLAACDRDMDATTADTEVPASVAQDSVTPNPTGNTSSAQAEPYTSATAPPDAMSTPPMDDSQQTEAPMSSDPNDPGNPADARRTGELPTTGQDDARTGGDATDDNTQQPPTPQP